MLHRPFGWPICDTYTGEPCLDDLYCIDMHMPYSKIGQFPSPHII